MYKYFGKDSMDKVFADKTFTLKFSFLKDYNDPYEFFLTVNFDRSHDELAFYLEMLDLVYEMLATCFSKSPINTPMWAHYCNNSEGFVIEINEDALNEYLKQQDIPYLIRDVEYKDAPHPGLEELLMRAYIIQKPRYVDMFRRIMMSTAYFTKQTCWEYEQERRLLLSATIFDEKENIKLLTLPSEIITSVIAGAKASTELQNKLKHVSQLIGCKYYDLRISKITTAPFFVSDNKTFIFTDNGIKEHDSYCEDCNEPLNGHGFKCQWCLISSEDIANAASSNPFRILHRYGLLENYIKATDNIHKK